MKLEQQVTSLEISKRLKELGVRQESYFYWWRRNENSEWLLIHFSSLDIPPLVQEGQEFISAFTVAELGEMLPKEIEDKEYMQKLYFKISRQTNPQWCCYYGNMKVENYSQCADTEADARGKMLIYLLENSLLKA